MSTKIFLLLAITFFVCCHGQKPLCNEESCKSLETVKECRNVRFCIMNVWMKGKVNVVKDDICNICLEMVKEARDQLESNQTRADIKEVLDRSCDLLKLRPVTRICRKIADGFVPELVAMLASQMDPETVCVVSKLCNDQNHTVPDQKINITKGCEICGKFVSSTKYVVEQVDQKDFLSIIMDICRLMGTYTDACFTYAPVWSNFISNQTAQALENHPCNAFGVCREKNVSFVLPASLGDAQKQLCDMCPNFVKSVKDQIVANNASDHFWKDAHRICVTLEMSETICKATLDEKYKTLFLESISLLDPTTFCYQGLRFCRKRSESFPLWPLIPVNSENYSVSFEDLLMPMREMNPDPALMRRAEKPPIPFGDPIDAPLLLKAEFGNDATCKACLDSFDFLKNSISTDDSYAKEIMSLVCADFADPSACTSFVGEFSQKLATSFVNNYSSDKVCPELIPNCTQSEVSAVRNRNAISPEEKCSFCLDIAKSLSANLDENESKEFLKGELMSVCQKLPSQVESVCRTYIKTFSDKTLNTFLGKNDEVQTCEFIKMCEKKKTEVVLPEPSTRSAEKEPCKICLMTVQTIYSELEGDISEEKIKKVLETVCSHVPSKAKNFCNDVIVKNADEIIHLIMGAIPPSEVCKRLGFCPQTRGESDTAVMNQVEKIPCNFCLTALKFLIEQLQNDKTEDAIRKALNKLCSYMPSETQDTCQNLIDQYTEDIIDMIIADFNATEICIYLKICGRRRNDETYQIQNFDVSTNEILQGNGPNSVCEFCQFLEKSMTVKENKDKAARGMLALLVDVCLLDMGTKYGECSKMVRETVLPFGKDALLKVTGICTTFKICPSRDSTDENKVIFGQFRSAVQECALCQTLVEIIASHEPMLHDYNFSEKASVICTTVPKEKQHECETMLVSYGPSIVNLLTKLNVTEGKVCSELKLCDETQITKLHMPVEAKIPTKEDSSKLQGICLQGPGFWCSSEENAKKCGALPHCQQLVWKNEVPPPA